MSEKFVPIRPLCSAGGAIRIHTGMCVCFATISRTSEAAKIARVFNCFTLHRNLILATVG